MINDSETDLNKSQRSPSIDCRNELLSDSALTLRRREDDLDERRAEGIDCAKKSQDPDPALSMANPVKECQNRV